MRVGSSSWRPRYARLYGVHTRYLSPCAQGTKFMRTSSNEKDSRPSIVGDVKCLSEAVQDAGGPPTNDWCAWDFGEFQILGSKVLEILEFRVPLLILCY